MYVVNKADWLEYRWVFPFPCRRRMRTWIVTSHARLITLSKWLTSHAQYTLKYKPCSWEPLRRETEEHAIYLDWYSLGYLRERGCEPNPRRKDVMQVGYYSLWVSYKAVKYYRFLILRLFQVFQNYVYQFLWATAYRFIQSRKTFQNFEFDFLCSSGKDFAIFGGAIVIFLVLAWFLTFPGEFRKATMEIISSSSSYRTSRARYATKII